MHKQELNWTGRRGCRALRSVARYLDDDGNGGDGYDGGDGYGGDCGDCGDGVDDDDGGVGGDSGGSCWYLLLRDDASIYPTQRCQARSRPTRFTQTTARTQTTSRTTRLRPLDLRLQGLRTS